MKKLWPITRYQALPHRRALLEDFLYRYSLDKFWRMPELLVKVHLKCRLESLWAYAPQI